MPGVPGSSSRGRGGKFKKYTRGGGKHFSRDIRPVDADGNQVSIWAADAQKNGDEDEEEDSDDSDDSEENSEEDSDEDEDGEDAGTSKAPAQDVSREDRKAEKKARKEAAIAKSKSKVVEVGDMPSSDEDEDDDDDDDDDMPANPNHSKAARNQTKAVGDITDGVASMSATPSRREREAMEAAAEREKYLRLQAQGKTDEAKADLERLKLIREQREAEAARKKAEREEKAEEEKAKRAEFEAREARKKAMAPNKKGKKK